MDIQQYPAAIAQLQRQVLQADQAIRDLKQQLAEFDFKIEQALAEDPELQDEQIRKVKRLSWQHADKYRNVMSQLSAAELQHQELGIQLEQLRNQFEVEKLLRQEKLSRP